MSRFKGTRIWPFNPRAMDSKTSPSTLYTLLNKAKEEKKPKQEDGEQDWIEHIVVDEFINIGSITKIPIVSLFENQPRYYVNMPKNPIVTNHVSIIKSRTWLKIWQNFHWIKLLNSKILKVQLKWH
jgi:hypothetical protein